MADTPVDPNAFFFGYMGITSALVFASNVFLILLIPVKT